MSGASTVGAGAFWVWEVGGTVLAPRGTRESGKSCARTGSDCKGKESRGLGAVVPRPGGPPHSPLPGLGPGLVDGSSRAGRWWWQPRLPRGGAAGAAEAAGGALKPGRR